MPITAEQQAYFSQNQIPRRSTFEIMCSLSQIHAATKAALTLAALCALATSSDESRKRSFLNFSMKCVSTTPWAKAQ